MLHEFNEEALRQYQADTENDFRAQIASLQSKRDDLQSRLDAANDELAAAKIELSNLKGQYDSDGKPKDTSAVEAKISSLEAEIASLEADIGAIDDCVTSLNDAIKETRNFINDLIDLLAECDGEWDDIVEQINELLFDYMNKMNDIQQDFNDSVSMMSSDLQDVVGSMDMMSPETLMGVTMGVVESCCYGGDPINMATGNFIYSNVDLKIEGAYPLEFKRYYNAMSSSASSIGLGWVHNFDLHLDDNGESIDFHLNDGRIERYLQASETLYVNYGDRKKVIKKRFDGYSCTQPEFKSYSFNIHGKVTEYQHKDVKISFTYSNKMLSRVTADCGELSFKYKNDLLTTVSDHCGRSVRLSYNNKLLDKVLLPNGGLYHYEYTSNDILNIIIDPLGNNLVINKYDENNRTIKQTLGNDGIFELSYDDEQMMTTSNEPTGNTVKYIRDKYFRTTNVIYNDSEEKYEFDKNNNLVSFTDRNSNIHHYEYDDDGNHTKYIDPFGNNTLMKYNRNDGLLVEQCMPNGAIYYFEYDSRGHLVKVKDPLGHECKLEYDHKGNNTKKILQDNSTIELQFDAVGNVTKITDANNGETEYAYDSLNRVVKIIDPNGNVTQLSYNISGDIIKVINPTGSECSHEYDLLGHQTKTIDYDGNTQLLHYNKFGKLNEIIDKDGASTKLTYDISGNISQVTDPEGNVKKYLYDFNNKLISYIDPEGNKTEYKHDPNGNVIEIISPLGKKTEYVYDKLNRRVEIRKGNHSVTKVEYDNNGNIISSINKLGCTTSYRYDMMGNVIESTNAMGIKNKYTYTPLGNLASVSNSKGEKINYHYYPGGLLQSIVWPGGEGESYSYDKNGNAIEIINNGSITKVIYDCMNRIIQTISPSGFCKFFDYDNIGNVTKITDENGNSTNYKYSLTGDLVEIIDALGNSTRYEYDRAHNLTKAEQYGLVDGAYSTVKNLQKRTTSYKYNRNGQVKEVHSPLGHRIQYSYDADGQIISKVDEDDLETLYEYNEIAKLSKISYQDETNVKITYDDLNQMTEMEDTFGRTIISYDGLGRVKEVNYHDNKSICYEWNNLNQCSRVSYPNNEFVTYNYNCNGQLESVNTPNGTSSYTYNRQGKIAHRELPNQIVTDYDYDIEGRMISLIHKCNKEVTDKYSMTYDPVGNLIEINKFRLDIPDDGGKYTYRYDSINQLLGINHNQNETEFQYDAFGNRTTENRSGIIKAYDFNEENQLVRALENNVAEEFFYDKRGNLIKSLKNGKLNFENSFNAAGLLDKTVNANQEIKKYCYNGLNQRVIKSIIKNNDEEVSEISSQVSYTHDITKPYNNLLVEEGSYNQNYYWGNELLDTQGNDSYYFLNDHLGSPVRLISDNFNHNTFSYDEFGNKGSNQNISMHNPFSFTGYLQEENNEFMYAQARYYDPKSSRMISKDPAIAHIGLSPNGQFLFNSLGSNRYTYCYNNPISFVDLSGYIPEWLKNTLTVAGGVIIVGGAAAICIFSFGAAAPMVIAGATLGTAAGAGLNVYDQYQRNDNSWDNFSVFEATVSGVEGGLSGILSALPLGTSPLASKLTPQLATQIQVWGNMIISGVGTGLKTEGDFTAIIENAIMAGLAGAAGGSGVGRGTNLFALNYVSEFLKGFAKASVTSNMPLIVQKIQEATSKLGVGNCE